MTPQRPNAYSILGVPPQATQAQITHAYRALLRQHHPDTRAAGDEAYEALSDRTLRQILAAYEALRVPTRRIAYDKEVSASADPAPPRPQQTPSRRFPPSQPPIVAGPVHWYRADGPTPRDVWGD